MKSKLFRVMVVLMILATLTLTNFIYVGVGAISYAASANDTNHKNVEFTANLKDEKTLRTVINKLSLMSGKEFSKDLEDKIMDAVNFVPDNKNGMNISRRTVAKYREEIGIKSSSKRKRF